MTKSTGKSLVITPPFQGLGIRGTQVPEINLPLYQFKWDNIADQFDGVFQEVLQAEPLVGAESVSPKKKGMCKKKRKKVPIGG